MALYLDVLDLELDLSVELTSERRRPGYLELHGAPKRQPRPRILRNQLLAAGFTLLTDDERTTAPADPFAHAFGFVATRGAQHLTINYPGRRWNVLFVCAVDPGLAPPVEIVDGTFHWDGVAWPALFEGGTITGDTGDSIFIDARPRPDDDPLTGYRTWAETSGYTIEDPRNAWEAEPDLRIAHGVRFRDTRHAVQVSLDDNVLTVYIATVPPNDLRRPR